MAGLFVAVELRLLRGVWSDCNRWNVLIWRLLFVHVTIWGGRLPILWKGPIKLNLERPFYGLNIHSKSLIAVGFFFPYHIILNCNVSGSSLVRLQRFQQTSRRVKWKNDNAHGCYWLTTNNTKKTTNHTWSHKLEACVKPSPKTCAKLSPWLGGFPT